MDAETYFLDLLFSAFITLFIILTPYVITRIITHRKIKLQTAKKITIVFSVLSFIVFCALFFLSNEGTASIFPIIIWNNVGYFIIRPKKDNVVKKTENNIRKNTDYTKVTAEELKINLSNRPLKNNEIRCNHCGHIQNNNLKRCLNCSKKIDSNTNYSKTLQENDIKINVEVRTEKDNPKGINISNIYLIPSKITHFLKNNCTNLNSNKYVLCDTLLFFNYLTAYYLSKSRMPELERKKIYDTICRKSLMLFFDNFDIEIREIQDLCEKRSTYAHKFFLKQISDNFNLQNIIDELVLIYAYDVTYNKYIDFNENSPIVLWGFDTETEYRLEIIHLFKILQQYLLFSILVDYTLENKEVKKTFTKLVTQSIFEFS